MLTLGANKPQVIKMRREGEVRQLESGADVDTYPDGHHLILRSKEIQRSYLLTTKGFLLRGCKKKLTLSPPRREERKGSLSADPSQPRLPIGRD